MGPPMAGWKEDGLSLSVGVLGVAVLVTPSSLSAGAREIFFRAKSYVAGPPLFDAVARRR